MSLTKSGFAVVEKITAWSYSRWRDYDQCPRMARNKHLRKKLYPVDDTSPAMQRGMDIDKEGEAFLKCQDGFEECPESFHNFEQKMWELRRLGAASQESWAFTAEWVQCENFAKACRCRIKTDAHVLIPAERLLRIIDFKSGKLKDHGYEPQMELYAIGGLAKYGLGVDTVQTELWFLDHPVKPITMRFNSWQFESLKQTWERRTAKMLADTRFDPDPGRPCTWCPYSQKKYAGPGKTPDEPCSY